MKAPASSANPILAKLRRAAQCLRKPQSVVAAHWLRAGLTERPYSPSRNVGITRDEYVRGQAIVRRLAACAR